MPNTVLRRIKYPRSFNNRTINMVQDTIIIDTAGDFNFFTATATSGISPGPVTQAADQMVIIQNVVAVDNVDLNMFIKDSVSEVFPLVTFKAFTGIGTLFDPVVLGRGTGAILNTNVTAARILITYYVSDTLFS